MKENRYFFYPVLVNMVSNIIVFVPHILVEGRFHGALMSMLVAVPIGMAFLVGFTKSMEHFPGQTLPDVLKQYLPRWVTVPFLFYITTFWYVYGSLILIAFTDITQRYLSPETSQWMILYFRTGRSGGYSHSDQSISFWARSIGGDQPSACLHHSRQIFHREKRQLDRGP